MVAVYSDFLFGDIGRDIGKEQLQARWGPVRFERQLGTIWPAEATGEPAFPARFIPGYGFISSGYEQERLHTVGNRRLETAWRYIGPSELLQKRWRQIIHFGICAAVTFVTPISALVERLYLAKAIAIRAAG